MAAAWPHIPKPVDVSHEDPPRLCASEVSRGWPAKVEKQVPSFLLSVAGRLSLGIGSQTLAFRFFGVVGSTEGLGCWISGSRVLG